MKKIIVAIAVLAFGLVWSSAQSKYPLTIKSASGEAIFNQKPVQF